jgi:hypothetical protein
MVFARSALDAPSCDDRNDQEIKKGMIEMKTHFAGLAVAAFLVVAPALPGHAEEAAPAAPAATPAAPPVSVPRPSILPKTAEPSSPQADAEPAPRRHYAHRHYYYRHYAYWEPFPVYLPHFYRHRIYWSRIPWFAF